MHYRILIVLASLFVTSAVSADVWRWVDPNGKTHYVDSNKAIYVWREESGRVFYSDKKDHDDAVLVQLVWHSAGTLKDVEEELESQGMVPEYEGESEQERLARESQEAKNCKRAQEIYDSYLNAPRLYRTAENGEKEYLSEKEAEQEIAETKIKVDAVCN